MGRLGRFALGLIAGCSLLSTAQAADLSNWPQWRGPQGTGFAPGANPPLEWSETKNVRWKVDVPGSGTASPIVWKNLIFLQTAIPVAKKIDPAGSGDANPNAATQDPGGGAADTPAEEAAPSNPPPSNPPPSNPPPSNPPPSNPPPSNPQPSENPNATEPDPPRSGQPGARRRGGGGGGGARRRGGRGGQNPDESGAEYQFVVLALDRQTGRTIWQQVARQQAPHEGHHADNTFASHSPVTDGTCVCAYFGSRGLYCYDLDGKLKWEKDLGRQKTRNAFGEGSSPALFGNVLVVNWDHEGDDFIAAFDKETGRELWRQPREEPTSWATPLVVEHAGRAQVITAATDKVRSYDLQSGELVWQCAGLTANAIPSPVAANDTVYVTSGFKGNALLAIRLGHTGDLTGTDAIAWSFSKNTPYVPSPLLAGNRLYLYSGNKAILSCFDVSNGKVLFGPARLEGLSNVYASPVGAPGRVYLPGRDGTTLVIADADELKVLATNPLDDAFDASPAVVDNELLLRGKAHLYCLSAE